MQSSLTTSLKVRGLATYLVLLRSNNYSVSVKHYEPVHNSFGFKSGFGVQQCQKRAGLNGYSMNTMRRIQVTWEPAPALLQTVAQHHFTITELLPCWLKCLLGHSSTAARGTRDRLSFDNLFVSTISSIIHNKRFYKTKFKIFRWQKQENYTTQRFLKISSRKWYAVMNELKKKKSTSRNLKLRTLNT